MSTPTETPFEGVFNHPDSPISSPAPALEKLTEAINTPPPKKTILEEAQEIIYGDREKTYGDPARNIQAIADLWSSYMAATTSKRNGLVHVSKEDVCNMMILMKVARLINTPDHRDSLVDIAGYAALTARCQDFVKGQ